MTALKPCPFCGETPDIESELTFQSNQGTKWGFVVCCCQGPEVRTGYGPLEDWREDAIEEWNTRAPDPVVVHTPFDTQHGGQRMGQDQPGSGGGGAAYETQPEPTYVLDISGPSIDNLVEVLRSVEWRQGEEFSLNYAGECHFCYGENGRGHDADCKMAKSLRSLGQEVEMREGT